MPIPLLVLLSVGGLVLARSSLPWRRLLTVALVGLAVAPALAALNLSYLADRLAVLVLVLVLIATIMAVREDRRAARRTRSALTRGDLGFMETP